MSNSHRFLDLLYMELSNFSQQPWTQSLCICNFACHGHRYLGTARRQAFQIEVSWFPTNAVADSSRNVVELHALVTATRSEKRIQGRQKDQRANGTRVLRYVWAFLFCLILFRSGPNLPSHNRPWGCKPYDARLSQLATLACTILTPHMLKSVQFYHTKHCVLVVLVLVACKYTVKCV